MIDDGWILHRRGAPNFIGVKDEGDLTFVFVERKGGLTKKQEEISAILQKAGLSVTIVSA